MCYTYIYNIIYIERERQRDMCIHMYVYIYIYVYTQYVYVCVYIYIYIHMYSCTPRPVDGLADRRELPKFAAKARDPTRHDRCAAQSVRRFLCTCGLFIPFLSLIVAPPGFL